MKRNKIGALLLTSALSVTMIAAGAVSAFAEDGQGAATTVNGGSAARIHKKLNVAKQGVTAPDITYTFMATPTDANGTLKTLTSSATTTSTNLSVDATNALFGGNVETDLGITTTGVYYYTVKETGSNFTSTNDKILTMDQTVYNVEVKVIDGASGLEVSGITAKKQGENTAKQDNITFNNTYAVYGNTNPTDDPNNPGTADGSAKSLVIKKTISGTDANKNKPFGYKITFTNDENGANSELKMSLGSVSDGVTVKTSEKAVVTNDELAYGIEYTFSLTNGQEVAFKVPAGTTYQLTETQDPSYKGTVNLTTNGKQNTDGNAIKGANGKGSNITVDSFVGAGSNVVDIENSTEDASLTGVVLNAAPFVAVIGLGLALLAAYVVMRRRRYNQ